MTIEVQRRRALKTAALLISAALSGAPLEAQFPSCTGSCHVVSGSVSDGTTGPFLSGHVYLATGSLTVPAGSTLTIGSGAIVKFAGVYEFIVDGTLLANGTSGQPIVLTSIHDDVGGDHNGNGGATVVGPGQWFRLRFGASADASVLDHVQLRGAGWAGNAALQLTSCDLTATSFSTNVVGGPCVDLTNTSTPIFASCAFDGGTQAAVGLTFAAAAGFIGCTAAGNSVYDAPVLNAPTVAPGSAPILPAGSGFNGNGVFVVPGAASIPAGGSLTLGAGVVLKFTGVFECVVDGALTTNGTAGAPVVFTSIHDDVHGGDTNKNGAATGPAAGQWYRLRFGATSGASSLTSAVLRCAGWAGNSAVVLDSANIAANGLKTELVGGPCLDLSNTSFPTMTNCALNGGSIAAVGLRFGAVAGFSNCTASGNSQYDAPRIDALSMTSTEVAVVPASGAFNGNGAFVIPGAISVPSGASLTFGSGAVLKFTGVHEGAISGTLIANGATGAPVVFTSIHDDAYGGDTNLNGSLTAGGPGQWFRLRFDSTSGASSLTTALVRCAGWAGNASVLLNSANIAANGLKTELVGGPCLDLSNTSFPTMTNCVLNGGTIAAVGLRFGAVAGFSGCTASGNSVYDAPRIDAVTLGATESAVVPASGAFNGNGAFVIPGTISIPTNAALTLGAGCALKFAGVYETIVNGTLTTNGTANAPVVFTSLHDDAFGGDTNKNLAATAAGPGQWYRVRFEAGSNASSMTSTLVRCAGWAGNAAVVFNASQATATDLRTQLVQGPCVDLSNNATPSLSFCKFDGGTYAATNVRLATLANFTRCTASGNSIANAPRVTDTIVVPGETANIRLIDTMNASGAIHLAAALDVNSGGVLDVGPGVVFKFEGTVAASVFGEARLAGNGGEPIVFTSVHDDAFGGDSNANGAATAPAAGQWISLKYEAGSTGFARHLRVRYAGWAGNVGFRCSSGAVALASLRADSSGGAGLHVASSEDAFLDHLVAFGCVGNGVRFDGAATLRHATAASCGGVGIRSGASGTGPGAAINCVSHGNVGGAYAGFGAAALTYCLGAAAGIGVGNFVADPLFTNMAAGDLSLQSGSPCLGVAEPFTSFGMVFDADEGSRILDGELTGVALPDLGAYERHPYRLTMTGRPWSGDTLTASVSGPPGIYALAFGLVLPADPIVPYGFLLLGPSATTTTLAVLPVGTPFVFAMPDVSAYAGQTFGLQALGVPLSAPSLGAFSNLYRGVLDG
jgi:hypothetical protein